MPDVEMRHGSNRIKQKREQRGNRGYYMNCEGGVTGCRATLGSDSPDGRGEGEQVGVR